MRTILCSPICSPPPRSLPQWGNVPPLSYNRFLHICGLCQAFILFYCLFIYLCQCHTILIIYLALISRRASLLALLSYNCPGYNSPLLFHIHFRIISTIPKILSWNVGIHKMLNHSSSWRNTHVNKNERKNKWIKSLHHNIYQKSNKETTGRK